MSIEDEIRKSKITQEMAEQERVAKELAEREILSTPQAIRARLQEIIDKNPGSAPAVLALINSQTPELVKEIFDYFQRTKMKAPDKQMLVFEPYAHLERVASVRLDKPMVHVSPKESGAEVSIYQTNIPLSYLGEPIKGNSFLVRGCRIGAFMKDDAPIIRFEDAEIRTDRAWEDTLRQMVIADLSKQE